MSAARPTAGAHTAARERADLPATAARWTRRLLGVLALALLAVGASPAWAHKPSDSYLTLQRTPTGLQGQWDIALRDLDHAIGLDADGNGEITWSELRQAHADIAA